LLPLEVEAVLLDNLGAARARLVLVVIGILHHKLYQHSIFIQ
jgi:hypothetical protein